MKKLVSCLLLVCLVSSCLSGCGGNSAGTQSGSGTAGTSSSAVSANSGSSSTGKAIVLKFNTVVNESHPGYTCMQEFEKNVEERSGGRIDVQLYPSSQLGGDREAYEALGLGELEMHYSGSFVLGNFTNKTKIWTLPFFFAGGYDAMFEFFDTYGDEIAQGIADDCGVFPVWTINGAFNPATAGKAISTPADMKGIKYRVHELDQFVAGYETLGAIPVVMTTAEVYTGLQQGAINGAHSEAQMMRTGKYYEVVDNYSAMNMSLDMSLAGISQPFLASLDPDLQEIILTCAKEWADSYNKTYLDILEETYAELENQGMTITYFDSAMLAPFQEAVAGQYESFKNSGVEPKFEEYYNAVQEINAKHLK